MDFDQLKLGMKVEMTLSDVEESPKFVSQFEEVVVIDLLCFSAYT